MFFLVNRLTHVFKKRGGYKINAQQTHLSPNSKLDPRFEQAVLDTHGEFLRQAKIAFPLSNILVVTNFIITTTITAMIVTGVIPSEAIALIPPTSIALHWISTRANQRLHKLTNEIIDKIINPSNPNLQ